MNWFVTGPKDTGKTTMLWRVLQQVKMPYGGYVVKDAYQNQRRSALVMCDLYTRERAAIAVMKDGRMVPVMHTFDTFATSVVDRAISMGTLIVLDELGRFELGSDAFMDAVRRALASDVPVIGVLKAESNHFLDGIRNRRDVSLLCVPPLSMKQVQLILEQALTRIGLI